MNAINPVGLTDPIPSAPVGREDPISKMPLVSVISINYNQTEMTRAFLNSMRQVTYPKLEIIIVDNASMGSDVDALLKEFPEIILIKNPQNLGFSGGNNTGIKRAKGEYFLLINNDVEVVPDFVQPLVEVFQQNREAGMVSPKIIFYNREERIQYAGSEGISKWTGRGKKRGYNQIDTGEYNGTRETALVHGACLMVSREVVNTVGLMHEDYFLYYEEHDWASHTRKKGFKIFYSGKSKIYHKESISTGKNSPLKTYYLTRSRLMYIKRNNNPVGIVTSLLFFLCFSVPKHIAVHLSRMDFANLRAFLKGIFWHCNPRIIHWHYVR